MKNSTAATQYTPHAQVLAARQAFCPNNGGPGVSWFSLLSSRGTNAPEKQRPRLYRRQEEISFAAGCDLGSGILAEVVGQIDLAQGGYGSAKIVESVRAGRCSCHAGTTRQRHFSCARWMSEAGEWICGVKRGHWVKLNYGSCQSSSAIVSNKICSWCQP
jgi:hypothetical protein